MGWVDFIVIVLLLLSLISGLTEGAVKQTFSLLGFLIAIPLAGIFYPVAARLLWFLGENWAGFIGFFLTLAVASIALTLAFLIPRKIIQSIWKEGPLLRLLGGVLNVINTGIGLVLVALALAAFPVADWLSEALLSSGMVQWFLLNFAFVRALLPETFRLAPGTFTFLAPFL